MAELPQSIGDYRVEALLGEGGMACVYRARHTLLDTVHAIKVLKPEYRESAEARRRFLDEARIQAKHLDHPGIVKVTNIVATAEHAALVMELVEGGGLEARLAELKQRPDEIVRIMVGVLDAVGHAHKAGIIHRDLKPTNVLLTRKGEHWQPKVGDFGIAKLAVAAGQGKKSTQGGARMGTLSYMSPEQIRGAKDVTPRSDIFSLGAMLYELATGEAPFDGDSDYDVMDQIVNGRFQPPERRYAGIQPRLAAVIKQALEVDPARRFASCEEMAAALRGAADAPATTAATGASAMVSVGAPPATGGGRRLWLVAGLVTAGAALGGLAVYLATAGARAPGPAAKVAPATPVAHDVAIDAGVAVAVDVDVPVIDAAELAVAVDDVDAGDLMLADIPAAGSADDSGDGSDDAPKPALDDLQVAPPANPCIGTWTRSGVRITITAGDGPCGTMRYSQCRGTLRRCTWSDGGLRATFICVGSDHTYTGSMRFACTGDRATQVDKTEGFATDTSTLRRH